MAYTMKGNPKDNGSIEGTRAYYSVKDVSNDLTETGRGVDVTKEYEKKGNKETRKHIASGGKVYKRADGSFVLI